MYRSGKGVWPFYCCDPGWSVFVNLSRDIFSRKQHMGDDDDDDDDSSLIVIFQLITRIDFLAILVSVFPYPPL